MGLLCLALHFGHALWPRHYAGDPRVTGARLAELVPAGVPLHVGKFKDEGSLFYFGQPTRKLSLDGLPFSSGPVYAVCTDDEYAALRRPGVAVVGTIADQQGGSAVVVRIHPVGEDRP